MPPRPAPSPRERVRAIVAPLEARALTSEAMFDAFWELDALPADVVRDEAAAWLGPLPDPERLDEAGRRVVGLPPPPLRLAVRSVVRDADVLDEGPVAEEQLRLAGVSWDGVDRPAEERLDDEIEGSFAGTLERIVLGEVGRPEPLFDVLRYHGDAGIVFAAGTTRRVAHIAYGRVESLDRRVRVGLEAALAKASGAAAPDESDATAAASANTAPRAADAAATDEEAEVTVSEAEIVEPAETKTKASSPKGRPAKAAAPKTKEAKAKAVKAPQAKATAPKAPSAKTPKSAKAAAAKAAPSTRTKAKAPAKKSAPPRGPTKRAR